MFMLETFQKDLKWKLWIRTCPYFAPVIIGEFVNQSFMWYLKSYNFFLCKLQKNTNFTLNKVLTKYKNGL